MFAYYCCVRGRESRSCKKTLEACLQGLSLTRNTAEQTLYIKFNWFVPTNEGAVLNRISEDMAIMGTIRMKQARDCFPLSVMRV